MIRSIVVSPRGNRGVLLFFALGLALHVGVWFQVGYSLEDKDDLFILPSLIVSPKSEKLLPKTSPSSIELKNHSTMFALPPLEWRSDYPSPVAGLLKFYIYENLPKELGVDVEDQLYELYRNESYDNNYKVDLALLQLFRSFPGRTWKPEEADIFVVPYLHAGHCILQYGWSVGCRQVTTKVFVEQLYPSLTYFNETTKERHLFLALAGLDHTRKQLRNNSLILTAGPRKPTSLPGFIVVSQLNDHPRFQPSNIIAHPDDWWTRPRKYAFVSHYGENNNAMHGKGGRRFRRFFRRDFDAHYSADKGKTMAGLPFSLSHGGQNWKFQKDDIYQQYADSVFCPILAGDMAWQRRFFDVIMSGCLPVVLSWNTSRGTSWHIPETMSPITPSIDMAYPFAKGRFSGKDLAVDYESFVVQCPGNVTNQEDVSSLRMTMLDLLENKPDEIRQRQLNMKEYAMAFSFGLGEDAHRYNDAFARIVRVLKQYIDDLDRRSTRYVRT
jgi:hypothetical protein